MSDKTLTKEQLGFLEECNEEFFNRFTEDDEEFMKVYHSGVPPPPILCPWYGRNRFSNFRGRPYERNNYNSRGSYHAQENHRSQDYNRRNEYNDRDRNYRGYNERGYRPN